MKVPNRTEAEARKALEAQKPLPVGWYDQAWISGAEDTHAAKSGNEMVALTFTVLDALGNEREIKTYLTSSPRCAVLIRHLVESVGEFRPLRGYRRSLRLHVPRKARSRLALNREGAPWLPKQESD